MCTKKITIIAIAILSIIPIVVSICLQPFFCIRRNSLLFIGSNLLDPETHKRYFAINQGSTLIDE